MSLLFPASAKMLTALGRKYPFMDFWGLSNDKITITHSPMDLDFGFVVVSGLPSGIAIERVTTVLTCRAIRDYSGSDNKINANQRAIRVMKAGGVWGVDDVVGIYFPQDSLYCVANMKEAGPVVIGWPDISGKVTGDDIYQVKSDQSARADALVALGDGLELYDVQVGLRVYYS